ncbi:MAG: hypothetical protein RIF36_00415 [Imperialibacter sp.]|uniref:hypothetical protein n=1 Tax=Imperialibacter sp. TaxID=2038411 RepID=UPI0032EB40E7
MKYAIFIDDDDPAFRYEGLVRAAFDNCGKYGDPFKYAAQEVYDNFVGEITLRGRRALSTALIKLIVDNPENKAIDGLKSLENDVWEAKEQQDIIKIIDEAIEILKRLE